MVEGSLLITCLHDLFSFFKGSYSDKSIFVDFLM